MLIRLPRRRQYYKFVQMMPRRSPHWRWTLAQQYRQKSHDPQVRREPGDVASADARPSLRVFSGQAPGK